jgi:peptide/nickel transport system substrate-binding protein
MVSKQLVKVLTIPLTLILILSSFVSFAGTYEAPHSKRGPAVDILRFRAFAVEIAAKSLEAGDMDMYIYSLKTVQAKELVGKEEIKLYQAPATMVSIILNPSPAPEGELNPFSIRKVRYALQFIVNREFVAGEIYRGLAVPMYTFLSSLDYDYITIAELIKRSGIRYDPEYAKRLISEAMVNAGAGLKNGKWYYNGKPVSLRFIIRVEDERREVGDLVASELEKLGFTVERIYQQFGPAISKVYGTDPKALEWHLYTEGWGKGSTERYDFGTINQMCAPWLGNMPGWQEFGFWQYENKTIDEYGQKIFRGEFGDINERNKLYRKATGLCLKESIRIWVVTVVNTFPARADIKGISEDLVAGPKSIFSLRDAYVPNKNELTIGHLWVWTERSTWNPIGGFGDVYSVDIWNLIRDPAIWRHPFSGLPIPFRASYKVETAGPKGKLDVPSDAFIWDAKLGMFKSVGRDVKATSKVVFDYSKYINSKWHHGIKITMGDLIYSIYQAFDLAYNPKKAKIERAISTTSLPYLQAFKGFRIVNDTAIEVYVDFWHFIPDYIAEYASLPSLSMPWELLYAMDTLVFDKRKAAYSDTASLRFQVPWLSLVMDKDCRLVKMVLIEFLNKKALPTNALTVNGKTYADKDEAVKRYKAAIKWFDENKNLVISNGPFWLASFDPASQYAELRAFRDETYPFKPGDWYFGSPKITEIKRVQEKKVVIGKDSRIVVELDGEGELGIRYLLIDPSTGSIVDEGEGIREERNRFAIVIPSSITSKLRQGTYQLSIIGYSKDSSSITEKVELVNVLKTLPTTRRTETTPTKVKTTPTTKVTEEKTETVEKVVEEEVKEVEEMAINPVYLVASALVIIVVIALIVVVITKRRR